MSASAGVLRLADLAAGPPVTPCWPEGRVLVVGWARTGRAVAGALRAQGIEVVALDDVMACEAPAPGVELLGPLEGEPLRALLRGCALAVVSPGVPPGHPVHGAAAAAGVEVVSEIELAWRVSTVPVLAVTGTNGKTTVTTLVASIAAASGRSVLAAGNIGLPLIDAVLHPGLDLVVAEVSSFQLAFTSRFHAAVATVLNVAADHLDWHGDLDAYRAAKARLLATQGPADVAVVNCDDATALGIGRAGRGELVTFGLAGGDYHLEGDSLVGPGGSVAPLDALARRMPHDVANALAACATAEAAGIERSAAGPGLAAVTELPHRVQWVASIGGVDYYDDSKATVPSAVAAALAGVAGRNGLAGVAGRNGLAGVAKGGSLAAAPAGAGVAGCVLIAGGRNKGLDLTEIAEVARGRPGSVRAVVAIGEAAGAIERAFSGWTVQRAASMDEAVVVATRLAGESGAGAVLLSPGCASFDWYASYAERGDDFARAVRALAAAGSGEPGAARR